MRIKKDSLRQKRHYRKRMEELKSTLGGRCVECGSTRDLTIDHVEGRSWTVRQVSSTARIARYWREFEAGVKIRLLCSSCNSSSKHHPEGCGCPTCIVSRSAEAIERECDRLEEAKF